MLDVGFGVSLFGTCSDMAIGCSGRKVAENESLGTGSQCEDCGGKKS